MRRERNFSVWLAATLASLVAANASADPLRNARAQQAVAASADRPTSAEEYNELLFGGPRRLGPGTGETLPQELTDYPPLDFSFVSTESDAARGPSLDPGGLLQSAFMPRDLAAQIDDLATLGFGASLVGDRSAKALYVSPQRRGLMAGVSYSPDAEDVRYGKLYQAAVTQEMHGPQSALRLGGTMNFARGNRILDSGDLYSLNLGATLVWRDRLLIGASTTWDRKDAVERFELFDSDSRGDRRLRARGMVGSVSYTAGPWTAGAYYQHARATETAFDGAMDRLTAMEAALSYRLSARTRLYGAYYRFDFARAGALGAAADGGMWIAGVRTRL